MKERFRLGYHGKFLNNVRIQAMCNVIEKQPDAIGDTLIFEANRAQNRITDKIGKESENRFDGYRPRLGSITSSCPASINEDVRCGVDRWITINRLPGLAIPVQVKSSKAGVNIYKDSSEFNEAHHGLMVVLNCGRRSNFGSFRHEFNQELDRICQILRNNPDLRDQLRIER